MASALPLLVKQNLKAGLRARAFWLIIIVALVPPALTFAWVGTHQNDVAISAITADYADIVGGDNLTFQVTVTNTHTNYPRPFNVTARIGYNEEPRPGFIRFVDRFNETRSVERLAPGTEMTFEFTWKTESGPFLIQAFADPDWDEAKPNVLAEIEEQNNYRFQQIQIQYPQVRPDIPPPPPLSNESANDTVPDTDVGINSIVWDPLELYEHDNATFTVNVDNAGPGDLVNGTLHFQVHRLTPGGIATQVISSTSRNFNVTAGGTTQLAFPQNDLRIGFFAVAAFLDTSGVADDSGNTDDVVIQQYSVDRRTLFEDPPEKATSKDFYKTVLDLLHFRLLIPLIALFYAAGVIEDEKAAGNLPYLLTRPVKRWAIPIARFGVSFAVAGIALIIGILFTFFLLLDQPGDTPAYLYWPILFSLLVLFVYTAVATVLGVVARRPYLVGLLYVLGFEAFVILGRNILVNGRPLLQSWVETLSLTHWVKKAFEGVDLEHATSYWPDSDGAVKAIWVLLAIGVGSLVVSAAWMRRREFVG